MSGEPDWQARWVDPECQIEVVWLTLHSDIKKWAAAARILYQEGAGRRSKGYGTAVWLCFSKDDAAAVREAFAGRLEQQRKDFGLER